MTKKLSKEQLKQILREQIESEKPFRRWAFELRQIRAKMLRYERKNPESYHEIRITDPYTGQLTGIGPSEALIPIIRGLETTEESLSESLSGSPTKEQLKKLISEAIDRKERLVRKFVHEKMAELNQSWETTDPRLLVKIFKRRFGPFALKAEVDFGVNLKDIAVQAIADSGKTQVELPSLSEVS